jgi:hypothetical protein
VASKRPNEDSGEKIRVFGSYDGRCPPASETVRDLDLHGGSVGGLGNDGRGIGRDAPVGLDRQGHIPFGETRDHASKTDDSGMKTKASDGYICLSNFVHVLWYDDNMMKAFSKRGRCHAFPDVVFLSRSDESSDDHRNCLLSAREKEVVLIWLLTVPSSPFRFIW